MTARPFDPRLIDGISVAGLVDHWAAVCADDVFLIDPVSGDELTFSALQTQCVDLANCLHAMGLSPGESVGYALPNGLDAAKIFFPLFFPEILAVMLQRSFLVFCMVDFVQRL